MFSLCNADLVSLHGREGALKLATAYQGALLSLSGGEMSRLPDRSTRLLLVETMLSEGARNGFDPERMKVAGLAVVDRSRQPQSDHPC